MRVALNTYCLGESFKWNTPTKHPSNSISMSSFVVAACLPSKKAWVCEEWMNVPKSVFLFSFERSFLETSTYFFKTAVKHPICLVAEICGRFPFVSWKLGYTFFLVGLEDDFFSQDGLFSNMLVSQRVAGMALQVSSNPFERWPSVVPVAVHWLRVLANFFLSEKWAMKKGPLVVWGV